MFSKVVFASCYRFLSSILSEVMGQELGLECEICRVEKLSIFHDGFGNNEDPESILLLIDYMGFDINTLCTSIKHFHGESFESQHVSAVYNVSRDAGIEKRLLELGVRGVFYDDYGFDLFKKGVSALLQGDIWFPRKILIEHIRERTGKNPASTYSGSLNSPLTPREKEILIMISSGKTNAEIAESLYISPSTVKTHTYNIFQKINVPNRIQATLWTIKHFGKKAEQ